jgi:hypothetical protein
MTELKPPSRLQSSSKVEVRSLMESSRTSLCFSLSLVACRRRSNYFPVVVESLRGVTTAVESVGSGILDIFSRRETPPSHASSSCGAPPRTRTTSSTATTTTKITATTTVTAAATATAMVMTTTTTLTTGTGRSTTCSTRPIWTTPGRTGTASGTSSPGPSPSGGRRRRPRRGEEAEAVLRVITATTRGKAA